MQLVCKLAYLKYVAENRQELDFAPDSDSMMRELLEEMLEREIYLEFFQGFGQCPGLERELSDKTIIEYRTRPRTRVCIHYAVLGEDGEAGGYHSEYMKEAYGGVCFKPFVLFFGESLQYYITEEQDGIAQVTGSGILPRSDGSAGEEGRYQLINDIVTAEAMRDYDTMDELLEEYYRKDFLNDRLFAVD